MPWTGKARQAWMAGHEAARQRRHGIGVAKMVDCTLREWIEHGLAGLFAAINCAVLVTIMWLLFGAP